MTMIAHLLSCPFCGNFPATEDSGTNGQGMMISCLTPNCVAPHVSYIPPSAAVAAWNTRSPLPIEHLNAAGTGAG